MGDPGRLVVDAKPTIRARLRAARRAMPEHQRTQETTAATAICLQLAEKLGVVDIASYAAMPDELALDGLHQAWWASGRTILFPRVVAPGSLAWHRVAGPQQLTVGAYGIREPDPSGTTLGKLVAGCLVLVPGTGFTRQGYRLGQGGGFYDRALSVGVIAVGVGFRCQLVEELPMEAHDRRMDGLVIAAEMVLAPQLS